MWRFDARIAQQSELGSCIAQPARPLAHLVFVSFLCPQGQPEEPVGILCQGVQGVHAVGQRFVIAVERDRVVRIVGVEFDAENFGRKRLVQHPQQAVGLPLRQFVLVSFG